MKIAIIGPKGTFTELALEKYKDKIIIKYVEQYTIQNKGDSLCLDQNI